MRFFHDIKMLIRSGSWDFMRSWRPGPEHYDRPLFVYHWHQHPVYYRPGTSDRGIIYEILIRKEHKAEYRVDARVSPQVILDIGANIGITSLWLAHKYPQAQIFSFEPMNENFAILQKNIAGIGNIKAFNFGLGDQNAELDIFSNVDPNNRGGFSLYQRPDDPDNLGTKTHAVAKIRIRNAGEVLKELGITKVDILKVDTEGAEYAILTALPSTMLQQCQWIMGELHGIKNFSTLALLEDSYAVEMIKPATSEQFMFFALSKRLQDNKA